MAITTKIKCSVGVFAYNEERNIGALLEALLAQELNEVEIDEIIVVASGCTDRTVQIAKQFVQRQSSIVNSQSPTVRVLVQEKREGKISAVNLFLREANNTTVLLESGDTIPAKNTVEYLVAPFKDGRVGMTGARPVPRNEADNLMGFTAHLLWDLHHLISLKEPKMGELVAFRKDILGKDFQIPPFVTMDEAYIESRTTALGYNVKYAPKAIVYNRGPVKIKEFLHQRRRNHAGHIQLKKYTKHQVSTGNPVKIFKYLLSYKLNSPQQFFFMVGAIILEATGRLLGYWDFYITKKSHIVWEVAESAK